MNDTFVSDEGVGRRRAGQRGRIPREGLNRFRINISKDDTQLRIEAEGIPFFQGEDLFALFQMNRIVPLPSGQLRQWNIWVESSGRDGSTAYSNTPSFSSSTYSPSGIPKSCV